MNRSFFFAALLVAVVLMLTGPAVAPTSGAAMEEPKWLKAPLTDVRTGTSFTMAGFKGKVVLVEMMAVWCPKCLDQQRNMAMLQKQVTTPDLVMVSLDIDATETADLLKRHVERYGFGWPFAVASREVAREISTLYGNQFLSPPATPMLMIDRKGKVHTLEMGIKSVEILRKMADKFLQEGK